MSEYKSQGCLSQDMLERQLNCMHPAYRFWPDFLNKDENCTPPPLHDL